MGVTLRAVPAHAFTANLVMDDSVFNNVTSMNVAQIDAFLNSFPSSCLSTNNHFLSPDPTGYSPSAGFIYGGNVSGGMVIYHAAQAYGLNPQVILATLQKESSVVSGTASYRCQYINTAMGYDCPDSGSCPQNPATESGFSKQVIHAAWLLKFGEQRSEGNVGWNIQKPGWDNSDDPGTCYGGPMTQGIRKRCSSGSSVYYDGYTTIDGVATHMDAGATAALYWYTPHFHGNQNFVSLFESWFGGTISASYYACHNSENIAGVGSGAKVITNQYLPTGGVLLSLTLLNNTGSSCIEIHTWKPGYQQWDSNLATNLPSSESANGKVIAMDNRLVFVKYSNTGSGKIEIHTWKLGYQQWESNLATNYPSL
jgi:hypothetical protein